MAKLKTLPELRDVATDQQNQAAQADLVIDRDTASRMGVTASAIDNTLYDAFGQRLVSIMFTQLNQYHVVLEVDPKFAPTRFAEDIYVPQRNYKAPPPPGSASGANGSIARLRRRTSAAQRHRAFRNQQRPLTINHQGQFPSVTISFNLAPRRVAGRSGEGD